MTQRTDPLVGFHYAIEVEGKVSGYFTECSGIGSEHEVIEHKVVDTKGREQIMKIPGRLKWENITLKRGITDNMDIWSWRAAQRLGHHV
jgi:phage tail-like protein